MSETKQLNVNRVYFRTPTSLVICPTQTQHLVGCAENLVVKHLCRFHGYAKSKLLCHKAVLKLKLFSSDASLRLEGLPALFLWPKVIDVLEPTVLNRAARGNSKHSKPKQTKLCVQTYKKQVEPKTLLETIHGVTASAPSSNETATLFVFEDDEAVIKMVIKARSPQMRHVSRTHRANEDWLCERINLDPSMSIRFVSSNQQVECMMTKVVARVTQERSRFFSVHCMVCLVMIRLTAALQHPIPDFLPVSRQSRSPCRKEAGKMKLHPLRNWSKSALNSEGHSSRMPLQSLEMLMSNTERPHLPRHPPA